MPDVAVLYAKKELRRRMLSIRRGLSVQENEAFSTAVLQRLYAMEQYQQAQCVFCYAAMAEEVQTWELLERALAEGKTVCLPKITGKGMMEAVCLPSLEVLVPGDFGILTVKPELQQILPAGRIDFVVVPGAAFSIQGARLGLGGGYYDRFLARTVDAYRAAVTFDVQLSEDIPVEKHDCYMDAVITEKRLIFCNPDKS